jgi:hypothetical protein
MANLVCVHLSLPTGQKGRAFFTTDPTIEVLESYLRTDTLENVLGDRFLEEDDQERFEMTRSLVSQQDWVFVRTYEDEQDPTILHAYILKDKASEERLFACVLAPITYVEKLLEETNADPVFETSTFQVYGDKLSSCALILALETWVSRCFPESKVKRLNLLWSR